MAGRSRRCSGLQSSSGCWAPSADSLLPSSGRREPRENSPDPEGSGGKALLLPIPSLTGATVFPASLFHLMDQKPESGQ